MSAHIDQSIFKANESLKITHQLLGELGRLEKSVESHMNWFHKYNIVTTENQSSLRNIVITCVCSVPDWIQETLSPTYSKINEIFTSIFILSFHMDDYLDDEEGTNEEVKVNRLKASENPILVLTLQDFLEDLFLGNFNGLEDIPEEALTYNPKCRETMEGIQRRMDELKEVCPEYRQIFGSYLRDFMKMIQASIILVLERMKGGCPPGLYKRLNVYPGAGHAYFEYGIILANLEFGLSAEITSHVLFDLYKETIAEIYREINDLIGLGLDVDELHFEQNLILKAWNHIGDLQNILDKEMKDLESKLIEFNLIGIKLTERFEDSLEVSNIVKVGRHNLTCILASYFYSDRYRLRKNQSNEETVIEIDRGNSYCLS